MGSRVPQSNVRGGSRPEGGGKARSNVSEAKGLKTRCKKGFDDAGNDGVSPVTKSVMLTST